MSVPAFRPNGYLRSLDIDVDGLPDQDLFLLFDRVQERLLALSSESFMNLLTATTAFQNSSGITAATLNQKLADYLKTVDLASRLSDYLKTADLAGRLSDYAKTIDVNSKFADYVKTVDLTTKLNDFVKTVDQNAKLADYLKTADLPGKLTSYAKTADVASTYATMATLNSELMKYATIVQVNNALANYATLTALADYAKKTALFDSNGKLLTSIIPDSASAAGDITKLITQFHDCLNLDPQQGISVVSANPGMWLTNTNVTDYSTANSAGILQLNLSSLLNNRACIGTLLPTGSQLGGFAMPYGKANFATQFRFLALSDATDSYTVRMGYFDLVSGEPANGCYWRYTHSVNGGRWQMVCRDNNVETAIDGAVGVTFGANMDKYEVYVANGTAKFTYNKTFSQTISTNVPSSPSRTVGVGLSVIKSAGVTAKDIIQIDYILNKFEFTTAR